MGNAYITILNQPEQVANLLLLLCMQLKSSEVMGGFNMTAAQYAEEGSCRRYTKMGGGGHIIVGISIW